MNEPTRLVFRPPVVFAFFDESGKWKDSEGVFVFAGVVGFPPDIQSLHADWVSRLNRDEIRFTSMKDAMNYHGEYLPFKGDESRRNAVLLDLADVIVAHRSKLLLVSSRIDLATQDAFNRLPKEHKKNLLGNPYYGAFEACVLGSLQARHDVYINITCDLAEEYSEKCITAFNRIRSKRADLRPRCLGIAFADDTWAPMLQVADMLAYCKRAQALENHGREPVSPLLKELISALQMEDSQERVVTYWFRGNLGEGIGSGEFG